LPDAVPGPAAKALACRSPVPVRLRAEINGRLPDPVETGAYYIVGEALANAAKHANATVVDVSIEQHGQFSPWLCETTASEAPTRTALGWPASPTTSTPSPEPCSCSARQAAEPVSSSTSQPEQPPPWQRAVVAGHKNKDLRDDPAIPDPAGAGSLAGPSDQQIHCGRVTRGSRRAVLAPRAGGL
jgi:hypothetical protein